MSTISNTTVLSNFASVDRPDLLKRLFGSLYISLEVYEEIQAGRGGIVFMMRSNHVFSLMRRLAGSC